MIESNIKYFTIIVCSFYIYAKLLNIKKASKHITLSLVVASLFSFLIYFIRLFSQPLTVPVLIVLSLVYITLVTKTEPGLSITTTIISFGSSFAFFSISSLLAAVIFKFNGFTYSNGNVKIFFICSALIQFLLSSIPWRFRRLKSGMPFLRSKGGGDIGVIISTFLLCSFFLINNVNNPKSIFFIVLFIFVFVCGMCIFFWWRNKLKKAYSEKLRADEIQCLRDALQKKDKQIKYLEQHNEFLSRVIHKDNKLIPAMELAIREYLQSFEQGDRIDIQLTGQVLLEQLKTISCERFSTIEKYQSSNEKLPLTGVFQIDALMTYMFNKARENGIKYELAISGSVKYMVENIISVSDLRTLLADIIENAVIATKCCDEKGILVSLGAFEGYYIIDVFDSGIPFEKETLINFGCKKTTTHADSGGSGIGLITASEILSIYNASFIIEEFHDGYTIYTKKVSIKFDNLKQYRVKTNNDEEIRAIPMSAEK